MKKYKVCNGKKISKKKLKKHFKRMNREIFAFCADMGLTKKDLKRLQKGKGLPEPIDAEEIAELFEETCQFVSLM